MDNSYVNQIYFDKRLYIFYKFTLLLVLLESMYAWFLWDTDRYITIFGAGISLLFAFSSKNLFVLNKTNIAAVALIAILQVYTVRDQNLNAAAFMLLSAVVLSVVIILKDAYKIRLIQFFTKAYAIILLLSLVGWILFVVGLPVPHKFVTFNEGQYSYENFFLFLQDVRFLEFSLIPRFSSIFLEPGHLGMISSLFLFANRFQLKRKPVLIIFIATLCTLSLAAYVLLLISATSYILVHSKKPILAIFIWGLFLIFFSVFFSNYNNGDNLINSFILERLKVEDGDIVGNNRTQENFDMYFKSVMDSDTKYFGVGNVKYSTMQWRGNSGYKVFLVQHGVVGTILLSLFYVSLVVGGKSKLAWIFLLVYFLSFLQRAYALWDVELLIFITAIPLLKLKNNDA